MTQFDISVDCLQNYKIFDLILEKYFNIDIKCIKDSLLLQEPRVVSGKNDKNVYYFGDSW